MDATYTPTPVDCDEREADRMRAAILAAVDQLNHMARQFPERALTLQAVARRLAVAATPVKSAPQPSPPAALEGEDPVWSMPAAEPQHREDAYCEHCPTDGSPCGVCGSARPDAF